MSKRIEYKKRGGPYAAEARYTTTDAWFYTNGGSITVVSRRVTGDTLQCRIPLRTLKKIVAAMDPTASEVGL